MTHATHANALVNETSPYLLQHAHNPVQWYPWCEEALQRARQENKPILLSIGYSACHWCHVMAHESFEDEQTAAVMNQHFINIKIDREERPDLDKIYQTTQQILTGRTGGWPLTMFLDPEDHVPFFGGTYFPPVARYGMPGFKDLLHRVSRFYREEHDALIQQNQSLLEALQNTEAAGSAAQDVNITSAPIESGLQQLTESFDSRNGGFGGAPKFPHPTSIELFLHQHDYMFSGRQHNTLLDMAVFTLKQMALGGIYDQLGGGFCRYSVDDLWRIPHFEKMLYDNGPLLALYSDAWQLTGEPLFKQVAMETADWVMREMQAPEGGYYSSLDADSEGEEGKFYIWTPGQVHELLDEDEFSVLSKHFGLDLKANFEGNWHLYVAQPVVQVAESCSLDIGQTRRLIDSARHKLFSEREQRARPGRDEKILTSWNGLMIKGMSIAAMRLQREDCFASAERSLSFVYDSLYKDGRLLATCKDGKAHLNAYLDDYAYIIDAILAILSCRWSDKWLGFAMELADCLLEYFYDKERGGFFFTSHDHETLLQRRRDFMDDALPSGNGIAAWSLLRLGHLTGEMHYVQAGENSLSAAWHAMERYPHAHIAMLLALEELCSPAQQIIIRGKDETIQNWQKDCRDHADIKTRIFAIPDIAADLPDLLKQKEIKGEAVAYICEGFQCLDPVTDFDDLIFDLKRSKQE